MNLLSPKALSSWLEKRPEDVRSFIGEGDPADPASDDGLLAALDVLASGETPLGSLPELLTSHPAGVRALGRIGRIRLLAWLADTASEHYGPIMHRLTVAGGSEDDQETGGMPDEVDDEETGSGANGAGTVRVLFLEDLIQLAKSVVAPRIAARMANRPGLDASVEAAASLDNDIAYTQGGI